MGSLEGADRRLQDRALRKGEASGEELQKAILKGPDSGENAAHPEPEDVENLSSELQREKELRDQRIANALANPVPARVPISAEAPLDDEL